jgi:hypothetical protein
MAQQFVVQLRNQPGALAALARALAARGVSIEHIGAGGIGGLAYAVLTTHSDSTTRDVLRSAGYSFAEGEPIVLDLEDRPGALADAAQKLADAGVNVHGILCVGRGGGRAEVAITVDDVAHAREVLGC